MSALRRLATNQWIARVCRRNGEAWPVISRGISSAQPAHVEQASQSGSTGYLLAIPALIATCLGYWQVERRSWKQDMLQRLASSINAEPIDVLHYAGTPPEYHRVVATGVYDYAHTQYIGPRPRSVVGGSQIGYIVITPLVDPDSGRAVLVNRGWVPAAWRDAQGRDEAAGSAGVGTGNTGWWGRSSTPGSSQVGCFTGCTLQCNHQQHRGIPISPQPTATTQGIIMRSEARNSFVPDNQPAQGQWFWIDVPALAVASALPHDTPLIEAVVTDDDGAAAPMQRGTVPTAMDILGGRTRMPSGPKETYPVVKHVDAFLHFHVTPQDHLHYALTWFALAGCTGYMAYRAARGKRGGGRMW